MIRATELALLAAPVALYFMWRAGWFGRLNPTRNLLLALSAALVALGVALAWTGLQERHSESSHYVPAEMRDGRIVPGHGT